MNGVHISFVNQSNDTNNSSLVILQKNVATNLGELAVAWRVIKNLGRNWTHELFYPFDVEVGACDAFGNRSGRYQAHIGQRWLANQSNSGSNLSLASQPAASSQELEIQNNFAAGSVDACVYRDGRLVAKKTGVVPQQKAVFQFTPVIWVGVVSQVEEGQFINSAILSNIHQQFLLTSLTKVKIVLTGGGTGPNALPFQFEMFKV